MPANLYRASMIIYTHFWELFVFWVGRRAILFQIYIKVQWLFSLYISRYICSFFFISRRGLFLFNFCLLCASFFGLVVAENKWYIYNGRRGAHSKRKLERNRPEILKIIWLFDPLVFGACNGWCLAKHCRAMSRRAPCQIQSMNCPEKNKTTEKCILQLSLLVRL